MGRKKGVREENREQCTGRRDREEKERRKKQDGIKYMELSSLLNTDKHTQSKAAAEIEFK